MMFSRSIDDLTPGCRIAYVRFEAAMALAGIPFMVTCTLRKHIEQFTLYAQGRMMLDEVNKLRKRLGWALIKERQNRPVTWTLESMHLPVTMEMVDAGEAKIDDLGKSRAFDFAILKGNRKPTWEAKVDVNDNEVPDYLEAAEIAKKVGLTPGAFWQDPDLCHVQI